MIKLCEFDTFEECNEAEHYDHLYQKAVSLASVSGVDLDIVRENNLHIQDKNGVFPLDKYVLDNNLILLLPEEYESQKKCWRLTTGWAIKYKLGDKFVYRKDHSDRAYKIIEVPTTENLILIDQKTGAIIPSDIQISIPKTTFRSVKL